MAFRKINSRKLKQAETMQGTAIKLYEKGEWNRALGFFEKSLEIFKEIEDKKGISKAYNNLGTLYQDKGEWDKAQEFFEKSLEIDQEIGDKKATSGSYNNLGILYQYKGEWRKSLDFFEKSLEIDQEIGNKKGISKSYNNLGLLCKNRGEWDKALDFFERSLEIFQKLGDNKGISSYYNNIGLLYQDRGEWEKSLDFFEVSLKIKEKFGDKKGISTSYGNFGVLYQDRGEWNKALEFYKKSLEIDQKLGDKKGISNTYNNLGILYQYKGEWDKALKFFEKSLEINQEIGCKEGISATFNNLGELNLKNGNWDNAKKYFGDSLEIAEKLAPLSTILILKNLVELSELEDKYGDALDFLEKAMNIVQSVGSKPLEIDIIEKFGDVCISKYVAEEKAEIEDLRLAEASYYKAFELASSLKMPLQKATSIRGLGIVASKKGNMDKSEKCFHRSLEILRKLSASFELQKTTLEYAKALYENDNLFEAEIRAKSVAFDALKSKNYELLRKTYLLLGDIEAKQDNQYEYYLKALETAEFNPKIYVRTCYHLIFRMQKMDQEELIRFISLLKGQNDERYFDIFLEALNDKIEGKEYKMKELPSSLSQELEKFNTIQTSIL